MFALPAALALAFAPTPRLAAWHHAPRSPLRIFALDTTAPPVVELVHAESDATIAVDAASVYNEAADDALIAAAMVAVGTAFAVLHASPAEAVAAAPAAAAAVPTAAQIFEKAGKRALGGGLSGALAGVFQVILLMWLRTTMNYQYRFGGGTRDAMTALYEEGGLRRFYRGVGFALVQTPLSRFGDTAANSGMLALLAASDLPIGVRTACASAAASVWRIGLTPIDTMKTTMQVQGAEGMAQVRQKVESEGLPVLFQGALANALASFVGNYPWYLTFNSLDEALPLAPEGELALKLCRTAALGISAACVSDCVSNSIRVLKTTRQTSPTTLTYKEAAQQIIEKDGVVGLFGRGLGTRITTNALQAAIFTVVWKRAPCSSEPQPALLDYPLFALQCLLAHPDARWIETALHSRRGVPDQERDRRLMAQEATGGHVASRVASNP